MCGIAGYIGKSTIDKKNIISCLEVMKNRGPDHQSYTKLNKGKNNVYLLSSRLAIIDLEKRSNMPMKFMDAHLVYNGELYNFVELRETMIAKGLKFNTKSDTEVFLKGCKIGLSNFLDSAEGMWAAALFEENKNELTLIRDRFGEKPLYYIKKNDGLYFGSEIKFIKNLINEKININTKKTLQFLAYGYKNVYKNNNSFFKNIKMVPPASVMKINNNLEINIKKYWIPKTGQDKKITTPAAIEEIRELLKKSVKIRLRSDVPIAFCLSGGIDSNSLIGISKKFFNYNVHGFHIGTKDKKYNENHLINETKKKYNIKITKIDSNSIDLLKVLKQSINYHDMPLLTINYALQWKLIDKIKKNNYKIMVSGIGADEILTGYYHHFLQYFATIKEGFLLKDYIEKWKKNIKPSIRNKYFKDPFIFKKEKNFNIHYLGLSNKYMNKKFVNPPKYKIFTKDILRNSMLNEMFFEGVQPCIRMEDLNSMHFSIENRAPFLDKNLFEFCSTIPSEILIQNSENKFLLRRAMENIVPKKVLKNKIKTGFNFSIDKLIKRKDLEQNLFDDENIYKFVNKNEVYKILKKDTFDDNENKFIFSLLSVQIFNSINN